MAVGGILGSMLSDGVRGLTDAAVGSTEQDRRDRALEHRERVKDAVEDWRAGQEDDFEQESIPF